MITRMYLTKECGHNVHNPYTVTVTIAKVKLRGMSCTTIKPNLVSVSLFLMHGDSFSRYRQYLVCDIHKLQLHVDGNG